MAALIRVAALLLACSPLAFGQYRAKIVLEDGVPFPSSPMVVPTATPPRCIIQQIFGNGEIQYGVERAVRRNNMELTEGVIPAADTQNNEERPDICKAAFVVQGYRKVSVTLHDGAVVLMKRDGKDHSGFAVSMDTLNAPPDARKAYENGVVAMARKKWAAAEKELRRAVTIYPQYAPAWSDLGETLNELAKPADARAAWEHAIQADPKNPKPYVGLARLAISENRMEDAASITERGIQTKFAEVSGIYLLNAAANLALGRLDAAETSARRAVDLDPAHELPKAEYLLGAVLSAKGDRRGALEHMKKYVEIAPKAPDAEKTKKRIAELEREGS